MYKEKLLMKKKSSYKGREAGWGSDPLTVLERWRQGDDAFMIMCEMHF